MLEIREISLYHRHLPRLVAQRVPLHAIPPLILTDLAGQVGAPCLIHKRTRLTHRVTGLGTKERLGATPEQDEARLAKVSGAVRTLLEAIGEDPDREGLRDTPARYAEAMMFFTKGYTQNLRDIVNGAVFHEDHDELVILKNIEVFSLCEHHLVPFIGKVGFLSSQSADQSLK